jgi:multiple antibiotic resistance protein
MSAFFLCFVPLFVAVNAPGVLPMFLSLTEGMSAQAVRRVLFQSVVTATVVALAFLAGGVWVLELLGITVADFMIAGGTLLFIISVTDLVTSQNTIRNVDPESLGAVPFGVPLLAGPAVFTTTILLIRQHGFWLTALAIFSNMFLAGLMFFFAQGILKVLGRTGTKTLSKISSLLLAAIGVMIVRRGLELLLSR